MKTLSSRDNSLIKKVASLHDPRERKKHFLFVVEGNHGVETFIKAGWEPTHVFVTHETYEKYAELLSGFMLITVSQPVMNKISGTQAPQGVLAVFKQPHARYILGPGSLVLTNISDPGNMGTLIRTAVTYKSTGVVIVGGCDVWSSKVVQASAGAHALVTIATCTWEELMEQKQSIPLCALVTKEGNNPDELDIKNSMIVVGSEAHGIPEEYERQCEQRMTLPMPGKTESLNAAVAGSIALYLRYQASKK